MPIPIIAGAGSMLARGVATLMRRYGLKKLEGKELNAIRKKGTRSAEAKAKLKSKRDSQGLSHAEMRKATRDAKATDFQKKIGQKVARMKQVGGNIGADAGGMLLANYMYSTPNELEAYVRENKPRIWAKYKASDYNTLKEYLKAQQRKA